jgi:Ca2+-binding RTX toxin-like protein
MIQDVTTDGPLPIPTPRDRRRFPALWSGGRRRTAAQARPTRSIGPQLQLEGLEDRAVPAILFTPQFGAEHASNVGRNMSDPVVDLVFWGSQWNKSPGLSTSAYTKSVSNLLNSIYLSQLVEYTGPPNTAVIAALGNTAVDPSNPPANFTPLDLDSVVANEIDLGNLPVPHPNQVTPQDVLYLVITQPGTTSASGPSVGGYHTITPGGRIEGWISDDGSLDDSTINLSHEMAEAITDPAYQLGVVAAPGAQWPIPDANEICDHEAELYSYRVKGTMAQSYWSQQYGAFIVPDGTVQNFVVTPNDLAIGQNVGVLGGTLTIKGDQLAPNDNDWINIDVAPGGGVSVSLNFLSETATFEPGAITKIVVDPGGGNNTIQVSRTFVPVTIITGSGQDKVTIGETPSGGSLQQIQGAVNIVSNKNSGLVDLSVNGAFENGPHTVILSANGVTGLAQAPITFDPAHVRNLFLQSGSGKDAYTVMDTPSVQPGASTVIDTGGGQDTVNVWTTHGPLSVQTDSGPAQVTVGIQNIGGSNVSSVSGIHGAVSISGNAALTVDDINNTTARNATLNTGSLTSFAPAPITWSTYGGYLAGISSLTIWGGNAGNTFTVTNTASFSSPINLNTGGGNDSVTVLATNGALNINGWSGQDSVKVGNNGVMDAINAQVTVGNVLGNTTLEVSDIKNKTPKSVTLSPGTVSGFSTGKVTYTPASAKWGGVQTLWVFGGTAGNTFNVLNTDVPTYLWTGAGNDRTYVAATTAPLLLDGYGGHDTFQLGRASGAVMGNVSSLAGAVSLYDNGGTASLYVWDNADNTVRTPTLSSGTVSALAPTPINYQPGQVTYVEIDGGAAKDTYNVVSTPASTATTVVAAYPGYTFNLGDKLTGLDNIGGPVNFTGGLGYDTVNVNDAAGSGASKSYTLNTGVLVPSKGGALTFSSVDAMTVNLSNGTDQFTLGSNPAFPVSIQGGSGSDTLVGPDTANTWTITGPNAGTVGNVTFKGIGNVQGGKLQDIFKILPAGALSGALDGGLAPAGSNNWLDYSARSSPVQVNLSNALGAASAIGGGVKNIRNVLGGSGNDTLIGSNLGSVLVGGPGNDKLYAGNVNSLLIGGTGSDSLSGGQGDDILIAGTTDYDSMTAALDAILAAWSAPNQSFTNAVAGLVLGVGPKFQYPLTSNTIPDDLAQDVLTAGKGPDWFWVWKTDIYPHTPPNGGQVN